MASTKLMAEILGGAKCQHRQPTIVLLKPLEAFAVASGIAPKNRTPWVTAMWEKRRAAKKAL